MYWNDATLGLMFRWEPGLEEPVPEAGGLTEPAGLAWSGDVRLVAERGANRILAFQPDGTRSVPVPATPEPYFLAADTERVFWGAFDSGTVLTQLLAQSPPETAIDGQGRVRGIALTDTHLVWTDRELGTLAWAPRDALGAVQVLHSDLGTPHGLAVVDGGVIWTDTTSGSITRGPLDGDAPTEVLVDELRAPWGLAWRP